MRIRKSVVIIMTILFCLHLTVSASLACWGTRPLAMGGAFSGLADDANAIYWNPAGLALSTQTGVTTMHNTGKKNDSNYDEYLGIALPMGTYGTLGAAFVYNEDILYNTNGTQDGTRRDTYYQLGYGAYVKKDWNLSLGASFKVVTKDKNTTTYTDQDEWFDVDIGVLWGFGKDVGTKKMFSLGALLQNSTEAQFLKKGEASKMTRNLRPGFAFHPDEKTTFSFEIYDALGKTRQEPEDVSQDLRLGVERWISEVVVLRAGGYHINNPSMRAYTGGIGFKAPADWGLNLELDFTIMYWTASESATKFIGLTYMF